MAMTTAVALEQGLQSPLFAIAACFSLIVMYDAMGVRRHAGLQAELVNILAADLLAASTEPSRRKLKEVLGHTPLEVTAGAALGVFTGVAMMYLAKRGFWR
ncbi:hypothetical protein QBZ16_004336 [Prototheca wickerhamii]|uniref:Uncharacterized protein n=1 Tax=Prototheca wickerhamii TaxID=3111 RepID=A0AAD9MMS7_PROWI|nr:hypothetical protein QBZ16_004336 [Prototheca wickerhamii]